MSSPRRLHRRTFLTAGLGAAVFAGVQGLRFGNALALPTPTKRLVFIFMRGGVDGLSLVCPLGSGYASLAAQRPTLALASPLVLSPTLGLHPALAALWKDATVKAGFNVVVQTGSVTDTRSHFDQQHIVESGDAAGVAATGFLGVGANALQRTTTALGDFPPASLSGADPAVLSDPAAVAEGYAYGGLKPAITRADRMSLYQRGDGTEDAVGSLALRTQTQFDSLQAALSSVTMSGLTAVHGYDPSSLFGQRLAVAAAMASTSFNPAVLTVDAEQGWDTHQNERSNDMSSHGAFGANVQDVATNLLAFKNDLVARGEWNDTVVVLMTEFGRTVKENAAHGTDHGRGGVMMLLGGAVRPHLDAGYLGPRGYQLPSNPDSSSALGVLHDYRVVMAEIFEKHLGLLRSTALGLFRPTGAVSASGYLNVLR